MAKNSTHALWKERRLSFEEPRKVLSSPLSVMHRLLPILASSLSLPPSLLFPRMTLSRKVEGRRTRVVSTVRRRRELSARRARAAREPNVRTILHEICRPVSLLRRVHGFASLPFFPPRIRLGQDSIIYTPLLYIQFARFPCGTLVSLQPGFPAHTRDTTNHGSSVCYEPSVFVSPLLFTVFLFSLSRSLSFVHLFFGSTLLPLPWNVPGTGLFVFI